MPWRRKTVHIRPFYDGHTLEVSTTGHLPKKSFFVCIDGGVALPYNIIVTANGDGKCIAVLTVADKVWAYSAIL